MSAKTRKQQQKLYETHLKPFFDSSLIKTVGKMPITLFGLGIPPQQYEELKKDIGEGGNIVDIYRQRTKKLAVDYPIDENYFAWQAFARKYDTENQKAIPEYLKTENHDRLKANVNRLQTNIGSVTDEITRNPKGAFNRFVFLDAQDWMNAEAITELWTEIAAKCESGARIIFRTAGTSSPIEKSLPREVRDKFYYEKEFSKELFKKDRASIYGGFHLYVLR